MFELVRVNDTNSVLVVSLEIPAITPLMALKEGAKVLQREILRQETSTATYSTDQKPSGF